MSTGKLSLIILACLLFLLAAVFPESEPYRWRLRFIAIGLLSWASSTLPYFTH